MNPPIHLVGTEGEGAEDDTSSARDGDDLVQPVPAATLVQGCTDEVHPDGILGHEDQVDERHLCLALLVVLDDGGEAKLKALNEDLRVWKAKVAQLAV